MFLFASFVIAIDVVLYSRLVVTVEERPCRCVSGKLTGFRYAMVDAVVVTDAM